MHTLAVLLAAFHAILALTATTEKSITADEIAHLTAGVAYNRLADFRLQPENGNLPQRWAGLPANLSDAPLPPQSLDYWRDADVWNYGRTFLYEQGLSSDFLLFRGRAMISLFSAAIGLLIFYWSRALFGWSGAFLSLAFYCFCPAFLAHGALTTSNIVMTFFFLAAVGAWWRHLDAPSPGHTALSVVVLGLACVAKFSAPLLGPMFVLIALAWLTWRIPSGERVAAVRRVLLSSVVHVVGAWLIIWLFYGFRYSAFAPAAGASIGFNHSWDSVLTGLGAAKPVIEALRAWHVFPEAFLYGFTFVVQFAQQRGAFLNGEYSLTGWVSFFPYAFLVKTTPAILIALLIAAGAAVRRWWPTRSVANSQLRAACWTAAPLAALFLVYWVTSLTSHLNIGHRHLLPTYPVLFIAVGALASGLLRLSRGIIVLLAALVVFHASESLWIRPHYLAYFNVLAGGPSQGWRHLVDSSLDWGQDLPGLRSWIDTHARNEKKFLSYFGTADPAYEGIQATMLPTLLDLRRPRPWHALEPGVYAVSATMLQHVYSPIRGDWTLKLETEYQELRALELLFLEYQKNPARRAELERDAPAERWTTGWKRYELLRFARLCHYLRVRPPDAMIGYSILVFRLSAGEIRGAVGGSINDWHKLIELAATHGG